LALAQAYFRQAAEIDLANNMGNAAGGVHMGALGRQLESGRSIIANGAIVENRILIVGVLLVLLGLHGVGHRLLSMATQSSHG
jgi:hypothetical protein